MDGNINALTTILTEFYYWVTVVLMFLIHAGFLMYEVAASRRRNHMHTLMKNVMIIPLVTVTFFLFGWWIYLGFSRLSIFWRDRLGVGGGKYALVREYGHKSGRQDYGCFLGGLFALFLDGGVDCVGVGH